MAQKKMYATQRCSNLIGAFPFLLRGLLVANRSSSSSTATTPVAELPAHDCVTVSKLTNTRRLIIHDSSRVRLAAAMAYEEEAYPI